MHSFHFHHYHHYAHWSFFIRLLVLLEDVVGPYLSIFSEHCLHFALISNMSRLLPFLVYSWALLHTQGFCHIVSHGIRCVSFIRAFFTIRNELSWYRTCTSYRYQHQCTPPEADNCSCQMEIMQLRYLNKPQGSFQHFQVFPLIIYCLCVKMSHSFNQYQGLILSEGGGEI